MAKLKKAQIELLREISNCSYEDCQVELDLAVARIAQLERELAEARAEISAIKTEHTRAVSDVLVAETERDRLAAEVERLQLLLAVPELVRRRTLPSGEQL